MRGESVSASNTNNEQDFQSATFQALSTDSNHISRLCYHRLHQLISVVLRGNWQFCKFNKIITECYQM